MRPTTALLLGLTLAGGAGAAGRPEPGQPARPLALEALDGTLHDLSTREGVGPQVLVFFRGAW